mmetsp:Transcript_17504/g.52891  ORF Transcript_17504/g.52891 Transcript_17504/m.52891 type:complete len:220 (+) Transcript_17504:1993-2652(+)
MRPSSLSSPNSNRPPIPSSSSSSAPSESESDFCADPNTLRFVGGMLAALPCVRSGLAAADGALFLEALLLSIPLTDSSDGFLAEVMESMRSTKPRPSASSSCRSRFSARASLPSLLLPFLSPRRLSSMAMCSSCASKSSSKAGRFLGGFEAALSLAMVERPCLLASVPRELLEPVLSPFSPPSVLNFFLVGRSRLAWCEANEPRLPAPSMAGGGARCVC